MDLVAKEIAVRPRVRIPWNCALRDLPVHSVTGLPRGRPADEGRSPTRTRKHTTREHTLRLADYVASFAPLTALSATSSPPRHTPRRATPAADKRPGP
jgi:hypothetical protein